MPACSEHAAPNTTAHFEHQVRSAGDCFLKNKPTPDLLSSCKKLGAAHRRLSDSVPASSGSSLTIDAPWLFPTQNVTGVVELSTNTLRTFVDRGSRYWMNCPLFGFTRRTRSSYSPPVQTSPFLSAVTSYGPDPAHAT